ncbi:hypothetical protein OUZ56_005682 [Daphnia magna]|uniref:Uncharacterized protein n=1 Tax=Daphnia magna TaxID=35525 RepID=A0ABQ9YU56_9CRUS|nr:hypothetical protein OUZ56_005682 [Daphnia magna]
MASQIGSFLPNSVIRFCWFFRMLLNESKRKEKKKGEPDALFNLDGINRSYLFVIGSLHREPPLDLIDVRFRYSDCQLTVPDM